MYVFDTSSLIEMFKFYPKRFPTLWKMFDTLLKEEKIISVHEVYKEIKDKDGKIIEWAEKNKSAFHKPLSEDTKFIQTIFSVKNGHFQHNIKKENILKGTPVADPFVIARAKISNFAVVTQEKYTEKGSKIPNICEHFDIHCLNLEGFMEKEDWQF